MQTKSLMALSALLTVIFTNCTSNEIASSKDVNQDKIYQGYSVSYHEGDANSNITATYRFGGSNGTTLVLSNPSTVTLDGSGQKVDSNWAGGAFYKFLIPAQKMYGTHELVFTTTENKAYANKFSIDSFSFLNAPKTAGRNTALVLQFTSPDLGPNDYIEVSSSNTDSSFSYTSVGNLKMVTIPEKDLRRQKADELTLDAILYRKTGLVQATSEGGEINIRQSLKPIKLSFN